MPCVRVAKGLNKFLQFNHTFIKLKCQENLLQRVSKTIYPNLQCEIPQIDDYNKYNLVYTLFDSS